MGEPILAVVAFALGASVGSFLNLAADRLPAGRSIVAPGSFCEACGRSLGPLDLVPILSYFWLKAKCRSCKARIPARFMVVEATTGLLFAAVYLRYGLAIEFPVLVAAMSLLLLVALIDLEHRLVLNNVMFLSMIALLVLSPFWTELGLTRSFLGDEGMVASLLNSILTGLGCFLVFLAIFLAYPKGTGGGDVKLVGVIGLLAGFPDAVIGLWLGIMSGGLVAIGLLALRKAGLKDKIPYGTFLASGAIAALLVGSEIASWYNSFGDFLSGA